jgi:hypothetical protein
VRAPRQRRGGLRALWKAFRTTKQAEICGYTLAFEENTRTPVELTHFLRDVWRWRHHHCVFSTQVAKSSSESLPLPTRTLNSYANAARDGPEKAVITALKSQSSQVFALMSTSVKQHDELQYLNLIRSVLDNGESRSDHAGTDTISLFAPPSLRFSLTDSTLPLFTLPLFTTTQIFLREIIEELLWLVKGKTDTTLLSNKVVKTWDGNRSEEFLESQGLGHRRAGDPGPVYGFQWRHFGAEYVGADADYSGKGVDQLRDVVRKITEDPTNRRIILSAWNPAGLSFTKTKKIPRRA